MAATGGTEATVALAGNAFITSAGSGANEIINNNGLANWTSADTVTSVYFRVDSAGPVTVSLDARLSGSTTSKIEVGINGTPFTVNLSQGGTKTYPVGTVDVPAAGYVTVNLKGVSKSGGYFGDVSALKVSSAAKLNYASDPASYYWSRRGPSVHMCYTVPANTEYFYNELTVPVGQDNIGSYFMANGFDGGYLGIQVNSSKSRKVLFSVWDADNGGKTTLVAKGNDVVDNRFGGEGTGGQTYLEYKWTAGNTYKFITRAKPDGAGSTDHSAWFCAPETDRWHYMATWKRPSTKTYLTGNYSFLENFIDKNGYMERRVLFGNQWARITSGTWTEVTAARYTGDTTAKKAQRMDFAGGLQDGKFFLHNGGFFSTPVPLNQNFTRPATGQAPTVNVDDLPTS